MSPKVKRIRTQRDEESLRRRKRTKTQVHDEAEATTDRDELLNFAGQDADLAGALSRFGGGMRSRVIHRLQQQRGNAHVQRMVAAGGVAGGPALQRQGGRRRQLMTGTTWRKSATGLSHRTCRWVQVLRGARSAPKLTPVLRFQP